MTSRVKFRLGLQNSFGLLLPSAAKLKMKPFLSTLCACLLLLSMQVACTSDNSGNPPGDAADPTLIGEEGGIAESADGNLRVIVPENAYTLPEGAFPEALSITIQEGPGDGWDTPHRIGEDYYVFVSPTEAAENLHAEATIELDLTEDAGEREVLLVGVEEPMGLLPGHAFDGETVSARVTDLTQMHFYAVAHELTDQCSALVDIGQSCEDSVDCLPDGAENATCGCVDEDRTMWPICHSGRCQTPITACAGIGENYGGQCEDYGGWTGDCFSR